MGLGGGAGGVEQARFGLTNLAQLPTVAELRYHLGRETAVLAKGWAGELLTAGRVSDRQGRQLDLGLGPYSLDKLRLDPGANARLHIDLADDRLPRAPLLGSGIESRRLR